MRDRTLVTRLLAALLTVVWTAGALVVLTAYRPGGPADLLVGLTALLPSAIAAAAIVWPPADRDSLASAPRAGDVRVPWAMVIAIGSLLLLVPSVAGLAGTLAQGPGRPLIPSAETAYGFVLPLLGTCVLTGVGLARAVPAIRGTRRAPAASGVALGVALTVLASALFAGATVANDNQIRAQIGASRWGPTGPTATPPRCDGALVRAETATVTIDASARVDLTDAGRLSLTGARSGVDERWEATVAAHRIIGDFAHVRIRERVWERRADGPWRTQSPAGAIATLDTAIVSAALTPAARATAEEVGLEQVGGAPARHCRLAVDGPTALRAVPTARWLIGREPFDRTTSLEVWRGDLDWWVFADASVGLATIAIHGPAFGGDWPVNGFQVTIDARITALDRGAPKAIAPPV